MRRPAKLSSAILPSTHILNLAVRRLAQVPEAEAGALALALEHGIDAPVAQAVSVRGQRTYIVERFDRETSSSVTRLVHTEDFAQAVGRPPSEKYGMTPLYDSIPVLILPELTDDRLAMKIGGAQRSPEVQMSHWSTLAKSSNLDSDRVVEIATRIGCGIRERSSAVFEQAGLGDRMLSRWDKVVASTTRHLPS